MQKNGGEDDSKVSGLSNWKDGAAICCDGKEALRSNQGINNQQFLIGTAAYIQAQCQTVLGYMYLKFKVV